MRLIRANDAKEALECTLAGDAAGLAQRVIDRMPTIDLVRCRECVGRPFWQKDDNNVPICLLSGLYVKSEDDFCPYGERKDGAE